MKRTQIGIGIVLLLATFYLFYSLYSGSNITSFLLSISLFFSFCLLIKALVFCFLCSLFIFSFFL